MGSFPQDGDFSNAKNDSDRVVSGGAVANFCNRSDFPPEVNVIRITGARVVGEVSIATRIIQLPLEFVTCEFDSPIDFSDARMKAVRFRGCQLTGITA